MHEVADNFGALLTPATSHIIIMIVYYIFIKIKKLCTSGPQLQNFQLDFHRFSILFLQMLACCLPQNFSVTNHSNILCTTHTQ